MITRKLSFKIYGKPVPKGRPRFSRHGDHVRTRTPEKTVNWEDNVRLQALKHRPRELWIGPLHMRLIFNMPRPKSLAKKVAYHSKRPDVDNLAKSIKDALQGVIYKDDGQIFWLSVTKRYSEYEIGVEVDIVEHEF